MAGQTYTVSIQGGPELAARLRKFGTSILDLTRSMDKSGRYLSVFFSGEVFASRGSVIGHPWPRLNEAYAARKAQEFPGRPPLIRTGLMNRSFKHNAGRLSVEVLNEAWYFRFHQNGEGVPQRVMMDLDQKRVVQVTKFVAEDITDKMEAAHV